MNKAIKASKARASKRLKAATKNSVAIKGTHRLTRTAGGFSAKYTLETALKMF